MLSCSELLFGFVVGDESSSVVQLSDPLTLLQLDPMSPPMSVTLVVTDSSAPLWKYVSVENVGSVSTPKFAQEMRFEVSLKPIKGAVMDEFLHSDALLELHMEFLSSDTPAASKIKTRLVVRVTLMRFQPVAAASISQRAVLALPSWVRSELVSHLAPLFTASALLLLATAGTSLPSASAADYFLGLVSVATVLSHADEVISLLLVRELEAIMAQGNDAIATAFRSESAVTFIFRSLCQQPESVAFARLCVQSLLVAAGPPGGSVEVLLKNCGSVPTRVVAFLKVLQSKCVAVLGVAKTRQLIAFFFFTRFVCPAVLNLAHEFPQHRDLLKTASKDLGLLGTCVRCTT